MLIEEIFGSKSKIQLLRVFHDFPKREFSLDELKRITKRSSGTIYPSLSSMVDTGVILSHKAGRSTLYRLNYSNPLIKKIIEIFEAESNFLLKAARDFTSKLNKKNIFSINIFGSVARNQATLRSDIDILIIYQKDYAVIKQAVDKLTNQYSKQDINISPILYSKKEVIDMKKRMNPFIIRINEEAKILYGRSIKQI